jgi:hypothetical protein
MTNECPLEENYTRHVTSRSWGGGLFDQLVELADGFDPQTCLYRKPMETAGTVGDVNHSLRQKHLKIFRDWLSLSLEEQMSYLSQYLVGSGQNRVEVARQWMNDRSYLRLVPPDARTLEKDLFILDLEVLLEMQIGITPDCHACQRALGRMIASLGEEFMRVRTLAMAETLYAEVPDECRELCLSSLGRAITTLEAGEFTSSWRLLAAALDAVKSRTRA